jgi:hypothetical protein
LVGGHASRVGEYASRVGGHGPRVGGHGPQVGGHGPQVGGHGPQVGEYGVSSITAELRTLRGISAEERAAPEYWPQDAAERTHVVTVECDMAFKLLEDKMRDIKRRYLFVPPRHIAEGW